MNTWQPIASAPKSKVTAVQFLPAEIDAIQGKRRAEGLYVKAHYILGYCPDEDSDLTACICVIWWDNLSESPQNAPRFGWIGEGGFEMHPTHWMPLPAPPLPPSLL